MNTQLTQRCHDIYQTQQIKIQKRRLQRKKEFKKKRRICPLGFRFSKCELRIFEDVPLKEYTKWLQKRKYRVDLLEWLGHAFTLFRSSYKCFVSVTFLISLIYLLLWIILLVIFGANFTLPENESNEYDKNIGSDHLQYDSKQNQNHHNNNNNNNNKNNHHKNNAKSKIKERLKNIQNPMSFLSEMETKISSLFFPRVKASFVSLMGVLHAEKMQTHAVHLLARNNFINHGTNKETETDEDTETEPMGEPKREDAEDYSGMITEYSNNETITFSVYFEKIIKILILSFIESIIQIIIAKLILKGVKVYLVEKKNCFSFKNIYINFKHLKDSFCLIVILTLLKSSVFVSQIFNSIIGIIVGLYLNFSFIWLVTLYTDKHTSIQTACKLSWQMVHRNFTGTLFLVMFQLIMNFTALTLYAVGLFITLPLTNLFLTVSYFYIFGCRKQTKKSFNIDYKYLDLI
ncbi:hypothetical protein M0812_30037 [Anaeramoeba flamelloides]|uniref:Uncharacterized protein n=1 Tax=Anaeramoeba flamelloides TaxID=1746091 RepID=A0AAV7Y0W8_9EUKA|nr:hypothetical protein M0812_30037 [Anaeramoeba flamelloides]